jgi:pilus assembly protein CpaB
MTAFSSALRREWEQIMRFGGLIAAIVVAALAAVLVLRYSSHEEPAPASGANTPPVVKTVSIFVAAQPIPIGASVTQEMVSIQPWPENLMLEGFIRADAGVNIVGMVARAPFQQQEPFLLAKLAKPSDPNFLAGSLPKGMRVITIQTNEIEGLAGFLFPGDHVDVILTHEISKWVTPPSGAGGAPVSPQEQKEAVSETLLSNVVVLAVDQRPTSANATDKNGNLIIPRSVTLMVTPTDAQRLRLGAQKGTLTLALRSLQDKDSNDPLIVTSPADLSQVPEMTGAQSDAGGVMVVRGTQGSETQSRNAAPASNTAPQVTRALPAPSAVPTAPTSPAPASPAPTTTPAPPPVASPTPMLPPPAQ